MGTKQTTQQLEKFLAYVVGQRPDEFGLRPDEEGWVELKALVQALSEEEGWRWVRQSHLRDLVVLETRYEWEVEGERLRLPGTVVERQVAAAPAKLYVAVPVKAHRAVYEQGLRPHGRGPIVLAGTAELALRMGRRRDQQPVLVTVKAAAAEGMGVVFLQVGQLLFTTEQEVAREYLELAQPRQEESPPVRTKRVKAAAPGLPGEVRPPVEREIAKALKEQAQVPWKPGARRDKQGGRKHKRG